MINRLSSSTLFLCGHFRIRDRSKRMNLGRTPSALILAPIFLTAGTPDAVRANRVLVADGPRGKQNDWRAVVPTLVSPGDSPVDSPGT